MPENAIYYHVAYAAAVVVYGVYAASIWWRTRAARAALQTARTRRPQDA